MYPSFPQIYLHRFTCGHHESYHGILVSAKNVLDLADPCARCEPNTAKGQDRLEAMRSWSALSIPYVTEDGDIVMAPRGSTNFPTVLRIREDGERYEASVVRQDSAEGQAANSLYGMVLGGGGT